MTAAAASRRTALVVGVANARSIAWSSARCLLQRGYDVVVTYQNDRFARSVETLVRHENDELQGVSGGGGGGTASFSIPRLSCLPCDLSCDDSVKSLFAERLPSRLWDQDNHSVAWAPPDAMKEGTLLDTTRKSFGLA
eukprot:CAMPEP_0178691086 /NCGR_PEP_ID=MMETSP0699-20121125/6418_1 /TAXON_ID=265572 /ORGANISM="Extubocellulus spinifer, Strain CCMP396" /LENGTH=137 /DNA_ID=CAMNT_0020336261 /DNA_START=70 /DNA_END=480 /DNA_ORIENTATION=+